VKHEQPKLADTIKKSSSSYCDILRETFHVCVKETMNSKSVALPGLVIYIRTFSVIERFRFLKFTLPKREQQFELNAQLKSHWVITPYVTSQSLTATAVTHKKVEQEALLFLFHWLTVSRIRPANIARSPCTDYSHVTAPSKLSFYYHYNYKGILRGSSGQCSSVKHGLHCSVVPPQKRWQCQSSLLHQFALASYEIRSQTISQVEFLVEIYSDPITILFTQFD